MRQFETTAAFERKEGVQIPNMHGNSEREREHGEGAVDGKQSRHVSLRQREIGDPQSHG